MRKRARNHKLRGQLRHYWLEDVNRDANLNWIVASFLDWIEYKDSMFYEPQGKREARRFNK